MVQFASVFTERSTAGRADEGTGYEGNRAWRAHELSRQGAEVIVQYRGQGAGDRREGGAPDTGVLHADAWAGAQGALALIAGAITVAAVLLRFRFSLYWPGGRTIVEIAIASSMLLSAWWLVIKFRRRGRLSNLVTAAGLIALAAQNFVVCGLPALVDASAGRFGGTDPLGAWPVVAGLFAMAAFTPRDLTVPRGEESVFATAVIGASLLLTILITLRPASMWAPTGLRVDHVVVAVVLLLTAGVGFSRAALQESKPMIGACLAGASILLAAAWSYDLLAPAASPGTLSGRDCLRLMVSGLILAVALLTRRRVLIADTAELAARERRRLVRDLHDGMAQDLAFIAAHGERLAAELGPDHPLVVAARRALATCRGAIVDLSAASASSAGDALRQVADELSSRHHIRIVVDADEHDDLPQDDREEIVRIAREAIVNAVEHGGARTVVASLRIQGRRLSLHVSDDGCGIEPRASSDVSRGLGLQTMRERAATLGGQLTVKRRREGGTRVEVVV
jgi:signal transduction histidine kinase